jgi:hypothetical protein
MKKTGEYRGEGTLLIDGVPCGSVAVPQTYRAQASFIGLEIGRAPRPAVGAFDAPFPFTGVLEKVVFDLGDDQVIDAALAREAALGRQ